MAMVFPSTAGGRGRQKDGSMGAVSGAPLTVTTYGVYSLSLHLRFGLIITMEINVNKTSKGLFLDVEMRLKILKRLNHAGKHPEGIGCHIGAR